MFHPHHYFANIKTIEGSMEQGDLICFKTKYFSAGDSARRVGPGYWRGFWKINDHGLVSKKAKSMN